MWTATRNDLITFGGLPAGAYAPDARQIAAVYVPQSTLEMSSHGFGGGGVPVRFAARAGSTLYAGIDPLTWYTVASTTDPDFFTLLDGSGNPIVLTDGGTGTIFCVENIWAKIDKRLAARTSWLMAHAKAYDPPWEVPPTWAPQIVAFLVAYDVALQLRLPERYPIDKIEKQYDAAELFIAKRLDEAGEPFGDGVGPVDAKPTVAAMGPQAVRLRGRGFLRHDDRSDEV